MDALKCVTLPKAHLSLINILKCSKEKQKCMQILQRDVQHIEVHVVVVN